MIDLVTTYHPQKRSLPRIFRPPRSPVPAARIEDRTSRGAVSDRSAADRDRAVVQGRADKSGAAVATDPSDDETMVRSYHTSVS